MQTALKLLAGDDLKLMRIIPLLLGSSEANIKEGNMITDSSVRGIMNLLKDNAFSHLMEVCSFYFQLFTVTSILVHSGSGSDRI